MFTCSFICSERSDHVYVGDKQILEVASDLCQVLGYFENAVINFSIQKQNDVFNTSHIGIPFAKYPKKISNVLYLHNPIIHLFDPPKNLYRHCFRFFLGHLHVPGEIVNNVYAKFWGVKEVYYGICASREFKIYKFIYSNYLIINFIYLYLIFVIFIFH